MDKQWSWNPQWGTFQAFSQNIFAQGLIYCFFLFFLSFITHFLWSLSLYLYKSFLSLSISHFFFSLYNFNLLKTCFLRWSSTRTPPGQHLSITALYWTDTSSPIPCHAQISKKFKLKGSRCLCTESVPPNRVDCRLSTSFFLSLHFFMVYLKPSALNTRASVLLCSAMLCYSQQGHQQLYPQL